MILRGRVMIPIVLAALLQTGFAPSAHALFGRHHAKKNTNPYAYLAPKKPKKSANPYAYLAPKKPKKSASPYAYLEPRKQKKSKGGTRAR